MAERERAHAAVRYLTLFLAASVVVGVVLATLSSDIIIGAVVGAGSALAAFRIAV